MRFDVNRLSVLAGLPASKSQRLSEASNRSLDDEKAQGIEGEADHRFGKGQLAEDKESQDEMYGGNYDDLHRSGKGPHHISGGGEYGKGGHRLDFMEEGEHDGPEEGKEEVYEVDEKELKEELMRLRRITRRKNAQKLQETQLKKIIEQEVQNVFKDLEEGKLDLNTSAGWVYGNNKPRNSRKGRIARGFKSLGFK